EPEALFHRQDAKDAKFSHFLRVLRAFAVRLQTILTINTQEGDYRCPKNDSPALAGGARESRYYKPVK
ncbi:MAG: hypothetical protein PVF45_12755, partial [Anaerolineae bacterium]